MKKLFLALVLLALCSSSFSQTKTAKDFGFTAFQFSDKDLGEVNYYVTSNGIEQEKPLLMFLEGSGHYPFYCQVITEDQPIFFSTMMLDYKTLSEEYHIAILSKPGTPFMDSLEAASPDEFMMNYPPSDEYSKRLSLDWRVNAASKVVDLLMKELKVDRSKVAVMGVSEGGQVVPQLAAGNKNITHVLGVVGGGLNQFADFIGEWRLKAELGEVSSDEAQKEIDELLLQFKDIMADPKSTEKMWYGHTYLRWSSFCTIDPLDYLLELDIPILIVGAGKDINSPIAGLDYIPIAFTVAGKTNLEYKVYPNCDHSFVNVNSGEYVLDEVIEYMMQWLKTVEP